MSDRSGLAGGWRLSSDVTAICSLRQLPWMYAFPKDEALSHAAHNRRCPRQRESLTNAIDRFDASAMCAHQIRHLKFFQLVGSPVQLLIGRRKQMQSADDCLHRLVRKLFSRKREDVDDSRVATAGNHDQPFRRIEY